MCGIVAATARRNIVPVLIEGLNRLEYRGYDSAGLAVMENSRLTRVRTTGRVSELASRVAGQGLKGPAGIAHTRWATHGAPSERNAHPHISDGIAVVHNGIIENHEALRTRLKACGYSFTSETDTEIVAHLIAELRKASATLFDAVGKALTQLQGAFAIAVVSRRDPGAVGLARRGAPLVVGLGDGENFAASDVSALLQVTRRVVHLRDGDHAELRPESLRVRDAHGVETSRASELSQVSLDDVDLGAHRHYMAKEIHEQPAALARTLAALDGAAMLPPHLFGAEADRAFRKARSVLMLGCGTSYHAAVVARYWLESIAGVPCTVEIASEYRYRRSVPDRDGLLVTVSQSGETADTLGALEHAQALGYEQSLAICNVSESSLARASKFRFITRAGPEIGVASTKAFTTQLVSLFLLTLSLAKCRGLLAPEQERHYLASLRELPVAIARALAVEDQVRGWAAALAPRHHALFLGRGIHYPIAMEGALKLKEITYLHAEAYAAGELKHGPLALVDTHMPVIAIAPCDALLEKLKSNLQEVRARGGQLFVLADGDTPMEADERSRIIRLPGSAGVLSPIVHTVPLQLLAYQTALVRGTDVDKPRNLAKSVTVE